MQNFVTSLQQIIHVMYAHQEQNPIPTKEFLEGIRERTNTETKKIKEALAFHMLEPLSEASLKRYIHHHQKKMGKLSDELLPALFNAPDTWQQAYMDLYNDLEDLLLHLQRTYPVYFNQDATIPTAYRLMTCRRLQQRLTATRTWLAQADENSQELQEMIVHLFDDFCHEKPQTRHTYQQAAFLTALATALELLQQQHGADLQHQHLQDKLHYLNFNTNQYFDYCTRYMQQQLEEENSTVTQLEKLALFRKNTEQFYMQPGMAYHADQDTIQQRLLQWIMAEIRYLETLQQKVPSQPITNEEQVKDNFRIQTSFTVKELGCLLNIFMQAGFVINKNKEELLRFIAGCTSSINNEQFSHKTFRTRFFNVDVPTLNILNNKIHHLLRTISNMKQGHKKDRRTGISET